MRSSLLPVGFEAPITGIVGRYTFEPMKMTPAMAHEDWVAVTTNAEAIARQRGEGTRDEWPFVCTYEDNCKDVAWLERCAEYGQLFSYVLRSTHTADAGKYAGCIYVYPIELQFPDQTAAYDVDFSFWITQAEEDAGNYPGAYDGLMEWVNGDAWPFDSTRVGVRNARDLSREHSSALMPLAQILTRSDRLAD